MSNPGGASGEPRLSLVGPRALQRALVLAAVTVLALLLLGRFAGAVAAPLVFILLAVILAMGLNPIVIRLETHLHLPRPIAAGLVMVVLVGALLLVAFLFVPLLLAQAARLSEEFPQMVGTLQNNLLGWAKRYPALAPLLEGRSFADPTALLNRGGTSVTSLISLAGAAANAAFSGFLLTMLVLYLLMSPEPMVKGLLSGIPSAQRPVVERTLIRIGQQLGAWLVGNLLISLIIGSLTSLGLTLAGFDDALLFGVFVAVTDLIPVVGPLIGAVPPLLVALADGSWTMAVWAAAVIFVVQQLEAYLISPLVYGRSVRLQPASLIVGVLVFGALMGLVGIFLTVPLLVIIKALYEEVYLASLQGPAVRDSTVAEVIGAGAEPVTPGEPGIALDPSAVAALLEPGASKRA